MACTAKKTVYFEVRTRASNSQTSNSQGLELGLGANAASQGTPGSSTSSSDSTGTVTAFDAISENSSTTGTSGTTTTTTPQQVIVAVPVTPSTLPVQFDPSPNVVSSPSGSP